MPIPTVPKASQGNALNWLLSWLVIMPLLTPVSPTAQIQSVGLVQPSEDNQSPASSAPSCCTLAQATPISA